jgi:eukaryotic-like serine/threonine-protein kinase
VLSSPLITGNTVWIGSFDNRFYALDLKTGEALWSFKTKGNVFASAAVSGDLIYTASRDGFLYCFQATLAQ